MELTSPMFKLPTGKAQSATEEFKSEVATAAALKAPQTWSAAVPAITSSWSRNFARPTDVPALPGPSIYRAPGERSAVPARSISPTFRPFSPASPASIVPITPVYNAAPPKAKPMQRPVFAPAKMQSSYNPQAIPAVMTTGSSASCAPTAVLAKVAPAWPAPTSTPGIAITTPAATQLPVKRTTAGTVIGASIFGGPITVGDPEGGLLHLSPYTETAESLTASPATTAKGDGTPLNKGEGWTDVFGISHGYQVPRERQMNFGRGAFNLQAPLSSYRGVSGLEWSSASTLTKAVVAGIGVGLVGAAIWAMTSKKR
jgi:hypothetical protein